MSDATHEHLATSESYPQYHMVEYKGTLHVCMKTDEDMADFGKWFSVGTFSNEEDFETVADNAAEEMRCMVADLRG